MYKHNKYCTMGVLLNKTGKKQKDMVKYCMAACSTELDNRHTEWTHTNDSADLLHRETAEEISPKASYQHILIKETAGYRQGQEERVPDFSPTS